MTPCWHLGQLHSTSVETLYVTQYWCPPAYLLHVYLRISLPDADGSEWCVDLVQQ
jgi:hypothetical protein